MAEHAPKLRAAVGDDQLPAGLPHLTRFRMAVAAGFEGVEMTVPSRPEDVDAIGEAAAAAGIVIHSVSEPASWEFPLSSPDPAVVARAVAVRRNLIDVARRWGADTVVLIAGEVDAQTSHEQAWARSQEVLRRDLLPYAEEARVMLAIENVWSGFLVSPGEYVRYIDELGSPWARALLDIGNVIFGNPEHWIRTAGSRTVKLHVKDFRFDEAAGHFSWGPVGDGDVDWTAVRSALDDAGFSGWATSTGIPRAFVTRVVERGARLLVRKGVADLPVVRQSRSVVQHALGERWLHRVATRFRRLQET